MGAESSKPEASLAPDAKMVSSEKASEKVQVENNSKVASVSSTGEEEVKPKKVKGLNSNGTIARWIEKTGEWLSRIESMEKQAQENGVKHSALDVFSPTSIALFGLSCVGMLGVGFKLGMTRELRKDARNETPNIIPGSLRERMNKDSAPVPPPTEKPNVVKASKFRPSAPAPVLAMRALGYATVLTLSTATFLCVAGKWYFEIVSVEDLIWRLKRGVPAQADRLKHVVVPPLESFRDGMQTAFKVFRPSIAPKGDKGDFSSTEEQERAELRELGIDSDYLLQKQPEAK